MQQAKFEDRGAGLARLSEGWFVVNVGDAEWLTSETTGPKKPSGAECSFETWQVSFPQLGVNRWATSPTTSSARSTRRARPGR